MGQEIMGPAIGDSIAGLFGLFFFLVMVGGTIWIIGDWAFRKLTGRPQRESKPWTGEHY